MTDVLILCGGLGSRLKSEVGDRQKCVAPVNGISFLRHLMDYIHSYHYDRFILCVGHMADSVKATVNEQLQGAEVIFSEETERLGTGGAIKYATPLIQSERFMVFNGDSICKIHLSAFEDYHTCNKNDATILLTNPDEREDCGTVTIDDDQRIRSFNEKLGSGTHVNAGVYLFSRCMLQNFPLTPSSSLCINP